MTDQGLSNRLRQQSRRSGIAIGITMAVTIAIGIFASAWVYGQLETVISDITGYAEEDVDQPEVAAVVSTEPAQSDSAQGSDNNQTGENQSDAGANAQPTLAPADPTPTPDAFESTHQSNPDFTVNLRPGPSVSSGDPISSVPPGTPLRFVGDEGLDEEGLVWLLMETQDGTSGWIREVDTVTSG